MMDNDDIVEVDEDSASAEETPEQSEDAVQSAKESLLNTLEQMERDVAQQSVSGYAHSGAISSCTHSSPSLYLQPFESLCKTDSLGVTVNLHLPK